MHAFLEGQVLRSSQRASWRDDTLHDRIIGQVQEHNHTIEHTALSLRKQPDFALLFPCMGRGPHFYGNRDRDLEALVKRFPKLPVIGMYGNGELGPLDGANHLYQYSAVLGLFGAGN